MCIVLPHLLCRRNSSKGIEMQKIQNDHKCYVSLVKHLGSNIFLKILSRHLFEIVIYLETFDMWKYK